MEDLDTKEVEQFSWIGIISIKTGGPSRVLHILVWIAVLAVIAVGLLSGQSLVVAVSPVSLALVYLLIRSGGKSSFRTDLPVQISLCLSPEEIRVFYQSIDRNDKKGERTERYVFQISELKQARYHQTTQNLMLVGDGVILVSFSDIRMRTQEKQTKHLSISLSSLEQRDTLLKALSKLMPERLVYC